MRCEGPWQSVSKWWPVMRMGCQKVFWKEWKCCHYTVISLIFFFWLKYVFWGVEGCVLGGEYVMHYRWALHPPAGSCGWARGEITVWVKISIFSGYFRFGWKCLLCWGTLVIMVMIITSWLRLTNNHSQGIVTWRKTYAVLRPLLKQPPVVCLFCLFIIWQYKRLHMVSSCLKVSLPMTY